MSQETWNTKFACSLYFVGERTHNFIRSQYAWLISRKEFLLKDTKNDDYLFYFRIVVKRTFSNLIRSLNSLRLPSEHGTQKLLVRMCDLGACNVSKLKNMRAVFHGKGIGHGSSQRGALRERKIWIRNKEKIEFESNNSCMQKCKQENWAE